jgi:RHS repeat-associated protein
METDMRTSRRWAGAGTVLGLLMLLAPPTWAQVVVEYYHLDAVGNVRAVTDEAGNVVERHDYLPFGEECTTGACAANPGLGAGQPRKFTGKERDQETGLDYFGARYYGSKIGRFSTVDPVYTWRENLVDPQRWNRYAYARNNPLRYVDPDGRAVMLAHAAGAPKKPGPNAGALAWIAYTIDVAFFGVDPLMVMPVGKAGRALGALGKADEAADALAAMQRGRQSETRVLDALGEAKNTDKVRGCEGCSIPDYQNPTTNGEVKDAARVDNTRQIRIQREAAEASGREHVIQTGASTQVSRNVERGATRVERRPDLGPQ